MRGLLLALLLGSAPADDELTDRVQILVQQLREDDIDRVDQASASLVELGPRALDPLRALVRRTGGDAGLRIEEIILRIARNERLRSALGIAPRVTIDAKGRSAGDVLKELSEQSGVPVEGVDLPEDLTLSFSAKDLLLWEAVDRLCRDRGDLMFTFTPRRVLIRKAPYRAVPHATHRDFFYFVDNLTWTKSFHQGVGRSYVNMQSAVVLPPGAQPVSGHLEIEVFEDDKGTRMANPNGAGRWVVSWGQRSTGSTAGKSLLMPLHHGSSTPPAADATRIERFKGRVVMTFALRMNRVLTIRNPEEQAGRVVSEQGYTVLLKRCRKTGTSLRVELDVTRSWTAAERRNFRQEPYGTPTWRLVLRDDQGDELEARVEHRGSSSSSGPSGHTETRSLAATIPLKEGASVASLELIRPEEFEEIALPFDFRGLPFGKEE